MAKGGARPGAGRKLGQKASHTLEAETYRKVLIQKIVEKAEPLAKALIDKGLAGDVPALKEINERALGKVKDSLDLTSKGQQVGFVILPAKNASPLATTTQTGDSPSSN